MLKNNYDLTLLNEYRSYLVSPVTALFVVIDVAIVYIITMTTFRGVEYA